MRADAEQPDYPFARFNKKVDVLRFSDAEYRDLCTPSDEAVRAAAAAAAAAGAGAPPPVPADQDVRWTKEGTEALFDLCRRFDLRWPVIADRCVIKPPPTV